MIRVPFTDGWSVARKVGAFEPRDESALPVPVDLPHDALRDLPRSADSDGGSHAGYIPGGVFEYTKTFDAPEAWRDKTVLIEFEGVYRDAVVTLNGDFVHHEANGYAAFTIAADGFLRFGEPNRVTVEARAYKDSRWYTGAGIYRPVHLLVADPIHLAVDGTVVTTPDIEPDRAIVAIATTVVNRTRHTRTERVSWDVTDANGRLVASDSTPVTVLPGEASTARTRVPVVDPDLWSPDAPHLYTVAIRLGGDMDGAFGRDEDSVVFGIRRLQLDAVSGLRINGEATLLRGACIHHDNGPLGSIADVDAEDRRVRMLKEAGFNAIRSAHNPASRALLDACDRHGMLVMDELTDVWTRAKTTFDSSLGFDERWARDVAALVGNDINHPSVVLYSIGNEILEVGTPHGAVWSRRLAEEVRRLDPTRFVTNGINGVIANLDRIAAAQAAIAADPNTMMAGMGEELEIMNASDFAIATTEEAASMLDVVGLNYAQTRYALEADLFPHRVIVGSETFPDRIASLWAAVERHPHVIGDFTWTGWDYLGEAGIGRVEYDTGVDRIGTAGEFPALLAGCGDIDITGFRRPASYYREIAFGLRSQPVIAVHRPGRGAASKTPWSWDDVVSSWTWDAPPGAPVVVDVYSDADEVELSVNGAVVGRARVGDVAPLTARFVLAYAPGVVSARAYRGGATIAEASLRTAEGDARVVLRLESDAVEAGRLLYAPVTVEDSRGVIFGDQDRPVTIEVSGSGRLVALGSGRPTTTERFGASSVTTFDGRALAIIRAGAEGRLDVTASSPGAASASAHADVLTSQQPQRLKRVRS